MKVTALLWRVWAALRWHLGLRVAARELEEGTDEGVARFYEARVTDCSFLGEPTHYEHPRARWILERVRGGTVLEVGCGNGGMTRLLAPQVDRIVALDVSAPSLETVRALDLPNVRTVRALIERYEPDQAFDWIVLSEVIEHLRDPDAVVARLVRWLSPGGALLVTTPRGHWESDEHLHEFSFDRLSALLAGSGGESVTISHLRDSGGRRRWLAGQVNVAATPPAGDRFDDRRTAAEARRAGRDGSLH